jgi:hypothetical protein
VALTVRASASGNFVSSLKLSATNDINTANDSRDVALAISGGDPSAVNAPKGGGGRIEFWMLALLAFLVVARLSSRAIVRPCLVRDSRNDPRDLELLSRTLSEEVGAARVTERRYRRASGMSEAAG